MGFYEIFLIVIQEMKGHKEGKKWPKLKWFNSDMKESFVLVSTFILPVDLVFFGFKKYLSAWFWRKTYSTHILWNAIKTTQLSREASYLSDDKTPTNIRLILQKLEISGSTSLQIVHIQVKQRQFEAIIFKLTAQNCLLIATIIFNTLLENCLLDRQAKKSYVRQLLASFKSAVTTVVQVRCC